MPEPREMPAGLEAAIRLIKSGDGEGGQHLLAEILARDPGNETAWLWMAGAVDDDERRRYCLSRVLQLNPGHALAREALAQMSPPAIDDPTPEPAPQATGLEAAGSEAAGPEMAGSETDGPAAGLSERPGSGMARPRQGQFTGRRRSVLLFLGTVLLLAGAGLVYSGATSLAGYARDPVAYAAVAPDVLRRFALLVAGLACLVGGAWAAWRAVRPAEEER